MIQPCFENVDIAPALFGQGNPANGEKPENVDKTVFGDGTGGAHRMKGGNGLRGPASPLSEGLKTPNFPAQNRDGARGVAVFTPSQTPTGNIFFGSCEKNLSQRSLFGILHSKPISVHDVCRIRNTLDSRRPRAVRTRLRSGVGGDDYAWRLPANRGRPKRAVLVHLAGDAGQSRKCRHRVAVRSNGISRTVICRHRGNSGCPAVHKWPACGGGGHTPRAPLGSLRRLYCEPNRGRHCRCYRHFLSRPGSACGTAQSFIPCLIGAKALRLDRPLAGSMRDFPLRHENSVRAGQWENTHCCRTQSRSNFASCSQP